MRIQPTIIFEDDHLVVVNKPANFLSIPDRYKEDLPSVQKFLKNKFGEIFTVHRIDKETSGIMIFAKTAATHKLLNTQFEDRQIQKIYLALTNGNIHDDEGIIDKPIGKHPSAPRMIITKNGKPSVSEYKVLERFGNHSLVEVNIKTGRTHQIRIHFQSIGYPLMVDPIYNRKSEFFLSEIKGRKYRRSAEKEERPLISRCTLHARRLQFKHPISQEGMSFEAELPKDFNAVVKQLRKLK